MSVLRLRRLALALLLAPVGLAQAEVPTIEHSAVKCIVAGKYRKMPARFAPPEVAQPRVYFRPEGVPSWYYVEMKPEEPLGHVGTLPKPTKNLVGQHIEYYVEAASKQFESGRTPEYNPIVVAKDSDCGQDLFPALYTKQPPSAVFPSVPQGFAVGGGVAAGTVGAVVGGGALAGGAVVVATKGDDDAPPPTSPPPPSVTPTPPPPVVTPTPPPATPGVDLACQADPRQGRAPLQVKFTAQATGGGGAGTINYAWDFGDGETSNQVNPSHTYTRPGVYQARVVATSGDRVAAPCTRSITVLANSFRLEVALAGTGTGQVVGEGIDCPGDCSEEYEPGRTVSLTARPTGGSTFGGWSGACSGAAGCTVTMDGDRSVTATFGPVATFALNVTVGGSGTGSVTGTGINCPGDCTESFPPGTVVALTANPTGGSPFTWGGDCTGTTGGTCNVTVNAPRNVSVTFQQVFLLSVTMVGLNGASGNVTALPSPFGTCNSAPPPGNTCTALYFPGEPIALFAGTTAGSFFGWTGDCASVTGTVCNVIMSQNRTTTATWDFGTLPAGGQAASVTSAFQVSGGRGQAVLNGTVLAPLAEGTTVLTVSPVSGENRLEARLVAAGKAGTWRFDLSGVPGLERGSVRVLAGEPTAVGPDSIEFRLSGREGERVEIAFTSR